MKVLYPPIKAFIQHHIEVEVPHKIYVEECGNPEGLPVLFVHGGPGAGSTADDRRYFDPMEYRIIIFDQRGCGRSKPHGELRANTTEALINDIETIRKTLSIERWMLFGGSWGSSLSLLYAQAHPERVMGMVLRGIFLCREQDLRWFYQEGARYIFPDYWEEFTQILKEEEHLDVISAYYDRLKNGDELSQMSAAKLWAQWEGRCATLQPCPLAVKGLTNAHTAVSLARIETHFFKHQCFIEENQILNNAHRLENIPGIIVHGRYDMVCPLDNALALHKAWQRTELHIIRDAGHSAREPGIIDALINATNLMLRYPQ